MQWNNNVNTEEEMFFWPFYLWFKAWKFKCNFKFNFPLIFRDIKDRTSVKWKYERSATQASNWMEKGLKTTLMVTQEALVKVVKDLKTSKKKSSIKKFKTS